MPQSAYPAVYMRGGTSRALIFHDRDLPAGRDARDHVFLATLGSPDPGKRQLDGLGGGISSLSKIAVVGAPSRDDADVDYTFGQVAIDAPLVQYRGNCGNISAAIGPYAVDEGLVRASGDRASVRIHNTNTGKIIVADFALSGGRAAVAGDFVLPGVAGTGSPIRLSFLDPGGATTGKLFPTGAARDTVTIPGVGTIEVSCIDVSNPTVFARAADFGLAGTESAAQIDARPDLVRQCEELRVAAAVLMGLATEDEARTRLRNLPLVCLLSPPADVVLPSGAPLQARDVDITARMFSAGQPHRATPLTGAMCLAACVRLPGTLGAELGRVPADGRDIVIGHASGSLPVGAAVSGGPRPHVASTTVTRTARRLMRGEVYAPTGR
ncbi:PrpF family protein [Pigmentiphaga sp. H8]|uniref:2-methylaconitate cis-trans isomerase PrpF family protein n=1 Tax=Pigmentiphaga sp. H8 TaxID=2488560 RepID=UPI000F5A7E01|nr:PrpF domain-containing protein [Pigmentiphaga sp. H8]AZG10142.1 PrpF family protein [Pigmentiphaga sp. H8]